LTHTMTHKAKVYNKAWK